MTTTIDLLRRAAEMLGSSWDERDPIKEGEIAACLLALADQMERAEPVAWMLRRKRDGFVRACYSEAPSALSLQMADQDGDEYILLYTHPAPEVTRDAERYRWLRADHSYSSVYKGEPFIGQQLFGNTGRMVGEHADMAVDKAMAAMQEPKP